MYRTQHELLKDDPSGFVLHLKIRCEDPKPSLGSFMSKVRDRTIFNNQNRETKLEHWCQIQAS